MAQQPSGSPSLFSYATANFPAAAIPIGTDVPWTQNAKSTIELDTGTSTLYTLTPGHVYLLSADLSITSAMAVDTEAQFQWVDAANNVLDAAEGGTRIMGMTSTVAESNKPSTHGIVDLTVGNTSLQVKLRLTAEGATNLSNNAIVGSCTIRQLF